MNSVCKIFGDSITSPTWQKHEDGLKWGFLEATCPCLHHARSAVLESVFLPFEARQLSAMFKAAPQSHCPPGIASLLVSRMQRGCWWKIMLSPSKTNWKYLWEKQTGIQVRLKRTTQTQSNIELSVNYFAAANLFDQNSVSPQLCFWFGWSTNLRILDWPLLEGRIAINWICVLWSKQLHTLGLKKSSQICQPCTSPAFIFSK